MKFSIEKASNKNPLFLRGKILVVLAVAVFVVLLSYIYTYPLRVFEERLNIKRIDEEDYAYMNIRTIVFSDVDGNDIAHIYVRLSGSSSSSRELLVSIWHEDGTRLDSLSIVFSSIDPFLLALETPEELPMIRFQRTEEAWGTLFDCPDLGFQGTGTVTLSFYLMPLSENMELNFHFKFSLHREPPFSFTCYVGEAFLEGVEVKG